MLTKNLAIQEGIKAVGVGKKGSKSLSAQEAQTILQELKNNSVTDVIKGAFFAGLTMKGINTDEYVLDQAFPKPCLNNPQELAKNLTYNAPEHIQKFCQRLLSKEELSRQEAKELGQFLMSDAPGDGARGLVASLLRVRYETDDEYAGLLEAILETIEPPFKEPVPKGEFPILQIAEPFDGTDHSYLITPLLSDYLQKFNYRVVTMIGRNSGPKYGNNLLDITQHLNVQTLSKNSQLTDSPKPDFGWYLNHQHLSKALDRWVDLRRQIIKRPFLSTLERFVNPIKADVLIASAFHPPYGEKMLKIGENAGFTGTIIIRNGIEGTIGFPLLRNAKILCSVKDTATGKYKRHEIDFDPKKYYSDQINIEEKMENPSPIQNAQLILEYKNKGHTDNKLFDNRVKVTCEGIKQALRWIESQICLC